ncbi:uncharacterized protein LOC122647666 [Telopea speciosissima]|uniref:uncharacterized protein LOC122647666 n=1 Tax=Telopea speciosissima TaxID=54955 RepID=UPI001CC4AEBB|nr:uncharacterized protein LOC122647666 [Telopea speciosissima]
MEEGSNGRAEAQRCLEIADKLLMARDLIGSKNFAVQAQEADPFLDGVEQILSIVDVLLAAEKRINNHLDWYAILQIGCQSNDLELIKKKYRRLAFLLHPDKNKSVLAADDAFKLVVDAWAVLSNPSKKTLYDNELNLFSKLVSNHNLQQQPVKPSPRGKKRKASKEQIFNSASNRTSSLMSTFWTTCPYCYNLYEYPRIYEECCLRCEKCKRAFHAVMVKSLPPAVSGDDEFFYCWGFFPLAFSENKSGSGKPKFPSFSNWSSSPQMRPPHLQPGGNRSSADKNAGFPNWMPFSSMFPPQSQAEGIRNATADNVNLDVDGDDDDSSVDIIEKGHFPAQVKERPLSNKKPKKSVEKANNRDQNYPGKAQEEDGDGRTEAPNVATAKPQKRKKTVAKRTQKQKGRGLQSKKETVEFDLNGEVGIEVEDSEPGEGTDTGSGDENVATGIGFFEGLDDLLGNMPIFNVVDDGGKVEGDDA